MAELEFTDCELKAFTRTVTQGGTATFNATLTNTICKAMNWIEKDEETGKSRPAMRDCMTNAALEGELYATSIMLQSDKGKLAKFEFEIKATLVYGFKAIRRELEGQRGKGHRFDVGFSVDFADLTGAAHLEEYMVSAGDTKGTLTVVHNPKMKQTTITEAPAKTDAEVDTMVDDLRKRIKNDPKKAN